MIGSLGGVASAPSATPVEPAGASSAKQAPKPAAGGGDTDSVHLSSTAQAQLSAAQAAVQEATETSAQTAKEAHGGDRQAQHLLAREAQTAAQLAGPPSKGTVG